VLRVTVVVAGLLSALLLAGSASATVIGQSPLPVGGLVLNGTIVFQTGVGSGASYTVPPGSWLATSWSFHMGAPVLGATGQIAALLAKPTGGGNYRFDAVSSVESVFASTLSSFPVSWLAHGGDVLGIWAGSPGPVNADTHGGPGFTIESTAGVSPLPTVGGSVSASSFASGWQIPIATVLTPLVSGPVHVNHVFTCYSKWEQDGGEVTDADVAQLLLDAGRWLPVALPGTVPSGENIGGYHLACNPPADAQRTNFYLGDGGDVLDWHSEGYYQIYT
jgi:hypothetical protein